MEGFKVVNVVLDGARNVGKSVLVNRLMTGKYNHQLCTIGSNWLKSTVMINQVRYRVNIIDTNGLEISLYMTNNECYKKADVIVEFFAIDCKRSLKETLKIRVPYFRKNFPKVPIVLVGTKADLRETNEACPLFPVELGFFLARCIGAVKYMECSSIANINVHEVFEEAVRCSLSKPSLEVIDKYLYAAMNISDIDGEWRMANTAVTGDTKYEWADVFGLYLIDVNSFTDRIYNNNPYLYQDIELVEQIFDQIRLEMRNYTSKDLLMSLVLESDKLSIAHGTRFDDVCGSSPPTCSLWYIHYCFTDPTHIVHCRLFSVHESYENVVCSRCPVNLRFFGIDCESIARFLFSTRNHMKVRSLVIVNCTWTLDFSFLAKLAGLEYLIIMNTDVDLATLNFPLHLRKTMKYLVLNNCGITQATDVPSEIGKLENLLFLNLANNNLKRIPTTLGFLDQLHTLLIDQGNVCFPPPEVLKRALKDVLNYLKAVNEYPVANTESKLIVVGQEGVGKSTLVKAMNRSRWFTKDKPLPKTDGVDISVLQFKDIQCKVYDLAGDVEYLNTHSLFLSSNTLHLVVYDLSRVIVDKGARSADHLCRLELWLETIASQEPKSKVILVGTHADHRLVNKQILDKNRNLLAEVLIKYCSTHKTGCRTDPCKECFICNPEKRPENLECFDVKNTSSALKTTTTQIPHVLGYFEVSGIKKYPSSFLNFHNINVEELKFLAESSISYIMKTTGTDEIPKRWLLFRDIIAQKLSSNDGLKQQPLMPLSLVQDIAEELEIQREEKVMAMLRFFHCQGTYLWYEDLPEMKDIVILDPKWLSEQLRTLISHSPTLSSICDGVLHLSELSKVWKEISKENQQKLLALFRSVGLCFSISDTQELFPCNLPVGWPDRKIWPPVPDRGENQTTLIFNFSFVPPSFFPDLTVEVNKKRETFARKVKPLYYRFHIIYIRKDALLDASGKDNSLSVHEDDDACLPTQNPLVLHTVHYELMPYNNSLTVAVRGPDPPSIIPDIRSTIETVKHRRYLGITYSEAMMCPKCVLEKVKNPDLFRNDVPHDGVCSRGHKVGTDQNILEGKYSAAKRKEQTSRVVGETLEDRFCPKLFVVLPINLEGLSLKDRFVYSYIRDGFAVHLLCECPGQWHFVDSPGFRVGKPKEFFEKYGSRVCKALRLISTVSTPIKAAASLDPHCKIGAAVGAGAKSVSQELQSLLDSYLDKYPHLKPKLGSSKDDLKDLKSSSGLQRSELSRFLEVEAKGRNFGPLVCTYVDKRDEWLWLCEEHNERFEIVQREDEND